MIKFGIIGCGKISQRHAQNINKIGQLIAVCDKDVKKAEIVGKENKAKVYDSLDEMLKKEKDIDLISICTPNGLHAEHAIKALKANFHVLCEKPMALNLHDCGEMIKEAEKSNKRLFVVKQNRFNPPIKAVKDAIDNNKLGKILSVQLNCYWNRNENYYKDSDWKGTKKIDGGILFTQFSHFIDLLYWMIGDIKEAKAYRKNFIHDYIEFEDAGVVILEFENGALGGINYTINSYNKNMEGSITIFGEKGTVKIGGQYLNELEYQNIEDYEIKKLPKGNPANNYGEYKGSMSNHDKVYKNIAEVLENNGSIVTNSFEGMKTIEIINKIYSSLHE